MTKEKASEIFLPVPYKIKRTNVHDCLTITMQQLEILKENFKENTEVKDCLIKMYQNIKHLKTNVAKPNTKTTQKPCLIKEVGLQTAERFYAQFFQKLHEYN
ncbi:hypothetical protein Y1Q_0010801 [Alligator mississippiensis]|uniref:Uncharacterized protein n=1 Tax=Alligator mississippiensis TaxID=8496 RepID=A0A151M700_ALLMI|nr:hypothetical protein Y1Q_0010801 [Alligator mississippiensis]